MSRNEAVIFKCLYTGPCSVGKSSLIDKLEHGYYTPFSPPTVGMDFSVTRIDYRRVKLKFYQYDCSGQRRFDDIVQTFYEDIDVAFLVIDAEDCLSERLDQRYYPFLQNILQRANKAYSFNIIINQTDRIDEHQLAKAEKNLADWLKPHSKQQSFRLHHSSAVSSSQQQLQQILLTSVENKIKDIDDPSPTSEHPVLTSDEYYQQMLNQLGETLNDEQTGRSLKERKRNCIMQMIFLTASVSHDKNAVADAMILFYKLLQDALSNKHTALSKITQERFLPGHGRTKTYQELSDMIAKALIQYEVEKIKHNDSYLNCHDDVINIMNNRHGRYSHFFDMGRTNAQKELDQLINDTQDQQTKQRIHTVLRSRRPA